MAPYQNGSGRMGVGSSLPLQGVGRFDSQGGKGFYHGNVGSGISRQGASSGYQGAAGNADYHDADNRKEQEKIRKKTFCSVPGCLDHVRGINEKVCEQHFKKENKLCWACEKNQADKNVHGVCIYCLATQGNLIKEAQQEQEKKGKNNNKGPIPQNLNMARGPANIGAPPNMGGKKLFDFLLGHSVSIYTF